MNTVVLIWFPNNEISLVGIGIYNLIFLHLQAYKDHILTVHEIGEYRYFCSQCPKKFTNSAGLIHHRGVHHNGAGNGI